MAEAGGFYHFDRTDWPPGDRPPHVGNAVAFTPLLGARSRRAGFIRRLPAPRTVAPDPGAASGG